jgi:hypothetical protein
MIQNNFIAVANHWRHLLPQTGPAPQWQMAVKALEALKRRDVAVLK